MQRIDEIVKFDDGMFPLHGRVGLCRRCGELFGNEDHYLVRHLREDLALLFAALTFALVFLGMVL